MGPGILCRGGADPPGDGGGDPTYYFSRFSKKLHGNEKILVCSNEHFPHPNQRSVTVKESGGVAFMLIKSFLKTCIILL